MTRLGMVWMISGLSVFFLLAGPGPAQDEPAIPSELVMDNAWRDVKFTYLKLVDGKETLPVPKMQEIAKAVARRLVYRINLKVYKEDYKKLDAVLQELEYEINRITHKDSAAKNQEFAFVFAKEIAKAAQDVLKFPFEGDNRSGLIYLGTTFPKMARLKQDSVADFLVDIVKDPAKHLVIKHYALKGLAEVAPVTAFIPGDKRPQGVLDKKAKDLARIKVLTEFLERPMPGFDKASPSEIEAHRFIRRECIRALAAVGIPAVDVAQRTKVEGEAIYPLLNVLAGSNGKNALEPPPSFTEKLEAAIGICNMKSTGPAIDPLNLYQPDMGIYLVGKFMGEFIAEYRVDFKNFAVRKLRPAHDWKKLAPRFWDGKAGALDNLLKQSNPPAAKNAKFLLDTVKPYLESMKNLESVGALDGKALEGLRPTGDRASVFQKIKGPDFP